MDILLEGVGMIVFLVLLLCLAAYTARHRGRVVKWVENLDTGNVAEKEERIKNLTREREDIDAELAALQAVETQEEK